MSDVVDRHQQRHSLHHDDVALAHRYRLSVSSPRQSSFRVVAVIYYRSSSSCSDDQKEDQEDEEEHHVVGTNDEPCHIGGSLCAERAAMLQLRFLPNVTVTRIVIVTDAPHEITPGPMCREFLASSPLVPWDVPVILGGSSCRRCGADFGDGDGDGDGDSTSSGECKASPSASSGEEDVGRHDFVYRTETVASLYPNPSPYVRLTSREAVAFGERFQATASEGASDRIETGGDGDGGGDAAAAAADLLGAAVEASLGDDRDDVHPIRYGAAVLFSDGSVSTARQVKGLEYGCTLDAVGQLAPAIHEKSGGRGGAAAAAVRPVMLVQADQFGIAHAPFAPGRAFLSEHGFGDCGVLVHEFGDDDDRVADDCDGGGGGGDPSGPPSPPPPRLVRVGADGLVPGAPRMGGGVLLREA